MKYKSNKNPTKPFLVIFWIYSIFLVALSYVTAIWGSTIYPAAITIFFLYTIFFNLYLMVITERIKEKKKITKKEKVTLITTVMATTSGALFDVISYRELSHLIIWALYLIPYSIVGYIRLKSSNKKTTP